MSLSYTRARRLSRALLVVGFAALLCGTLVHPAFIAVSSAAFTVAVAIAAHSAGRAAQAADEMLDTAAGFALLADVDMTDEMLVPYFDVLRAFSPDAYPARADYRAFIVERAAQLDDSER